MKPFRKQVGGGPGPQGGIQDEAANWFVAIDESQSGKISVPELQQALTNSDWSPFNEETCRLMIDMFDKDKCGEVDLEGFKALWGYVQQWRAIFEQFDRDRSGAIEQAEFCTALQQMGYSLSPEFANTVIGHYDRQNQLCLSFDNFIQACVKLKSLTDAFRLRDVQMEGTVNVSYEEFLSMIIPHH